MSASTVLHSANRHTDSDRQRQKVDSCSLFNVHSFVLLVAAVVGSCVPMQKETVAMLSSWCPWRSWLYDDGECRRGSKVGRRTPHSPPGGETQPCIWPRSDSTGRN